MVNCKRVKCISIDIYKLLFYVFIYIRISIEGIVENRNILYKKNILVIFEFVFVILLYLILEIISYYSWWDFGMVIFLVWVLDIN